MRLITISLALSLSMGCVSLDPTKSNLEERTTARCLWAGPYKLPVPDTMAACLKQTREAQAWLESQPQDYQFHRCLVETKDRFGVDAFNARRCIERAKETT